jgi:hypothetical protein
MFGGKKRIRKSRAKRFRGGSNMYSLSPSDASGLQTTGSSNYASAPNDAATPSAPLKGGGQRPLAKTRGRGRGRSSGIGGYWAAVLEQAIVPLTLLGIQQTYGRKRHLKGRTFKRKRHR